MGTGFAKQVWAPGSSRAPSRPSPIPSFNHRGSSPGPPRSGMLIYKQHTGIYPDFWQEPTQWSKHLSPAVYRDKTQAPKHQVHVRTGRGPGTRGARLHRSVPPHPTPRAPQSSTRCPSPPSGPAPPASKPCSHPDPCQSLSTPDTPLNPSCRTRCCSQFGLFFTSDSLYICFCDSGAESNDFEVTLMQ